MKKLRKVDWGFRGKICNVNHGTIINAMNTGLLNEPLKYENFNKWKFKTKPLLKIRCNYVSGETYCNWRQGRVHKVMEEKCRQSHVGINYDNIIAPYQIRTTVTTTKGVF